MIVTDRVLENVIDAGLSNGADFAEIFLEDTYVSQLGWIDKKADAALVGKNLGAGVRLFYGTEIVYVTTNSISEASLMEAAKTAAKARSGEKTLKVQSLLQTKFDNIHSLDFLPWEMNKKEKFSFLEKADTSARSYSSLISQVSANLSERLQKVQIANSDGLNTYDTRCYSRFTVNAIAEKEGNKEGGNAHSGALLGSEHFQRIDIDGLAREAAREASTMVDAEYAPAGEMPVIIESGFGGVIFHEACGHGLETTSIAKNASVFCGKLNERVAKECVTAIDDGTMVNTWGSINIDDEGMPTKKTTLIENGVLKSYIVDHMGSIKTGYDRTGSGRRESYKYDPASRMRNTYLAEGESNLEQMLNTMGDGIYAKKMGGGSVSPGTGDYNFKVTEAYRVEGGKIKEPLKGASLIGRGIDTLGQISMVGKNLDFSDGMCGSVSGAVPVTVGQPAILVDKITVGGRSA